MTNDKLENEDKKVSPKSGCLKRILLGILIALLALVVIAAIAVACVLGHGGKTLQAKAEGDVPTLDGGTGYVYNEDIMTFLFMGIDKAGKLKTTDVFADGGQSDVMFLVVVNPDEERIDLINVNRDTIVDIYCYGSVINGATEVVKAQLTTQYGFGDGASLSAKYTEEAVSKLFYDLPITGYVSLGFDAITVLNDAIGGVDVVCPEDLTFDVPYWTKGAELHLEGYYAVHYVRLRDVTVFESARTRQVRQKQYVNAFVDKTLSEIKKDITLPVTMYQQAVKYMNTDLTLDQMAYLGSKALSYELGEIYSLEGKTVMGEQFEEFYPDEEKLKDLILQVFYEPVNE